MKHYHRKLRCAHKFTNKLMEFRRLHLPFVTTGGGGKLALGVGIVVQCKYFSAEFP